MVQQHGMQRGCCTQHRLQRSMAAGAGPAAPLAPGPSPRTRQGVEVAQHARPLHRLAKPLRVHAWQPHVHAEPAEHYEALQQARGGTL